MRDSSCVHLYSFIMHLSWTLLGSATFLFNPKKCPCQNLLPKKSARKFQTPKSPLIANFKPKKGLHTSPSLNKYTWVPSLGLFLPQPDHFCCTFYQKHLQKQWRGLTAIFLTMGYCMLLHKMWVQWALHWGEGVLLYISYMYIGTVVCAAPKGMVFEPF